MGQLACGTGAVATATLDFTKAPVGGMQKFVDGLPGLGSAAANNLGQYIPVAVADTTSYPPGGAGYAGIPTVTITDATGTGAVATATVTNGTVSAVTIVNGGAGYSSNPTVVFSGGNPTTGAAGRAVVVGGAVTAIDLVGSDYYEIALVEYTERMHSDLPATRQRGYVQLVTPVVFPVAPDVPFPLANVDGSPILKPDGTPALAMDAPHYLGPTIVVRRTPKPVV